MAGLAASAVSRRAGLGAGGIIGGRVTLALHPSALSRLAAGRRVVLVSGTNGKTTTSHLLAAALRTAGPVVHNASGANMADGAVAALAADLDATTAVIEVDELHLAAVAAAVSPAVIVLLNLSRDQLDRGSEVRAVAAALAVPLAAHPDTVVVANADDPMVVWAAQQAARTVWVATGSRWSADADSCPRCGATLHRGDADEEKWWCDCGLTRPDPQWSALDDAAVTGGEVVALGLRLPGRFNVGNAVMALAAGSLLGVEHRVGAAAMAQLPDVGGRYALLTHGEHRLRLLLAKNPAGWTETVGLLQDCRPLLVVVNAREADGRDTSWLWDVAFEQLGARPVVAAGENAADLGVRLSYAGIAHTTVGDPLAGLGQLQPGRVDVVANYTAFHQLRRRLVTAEGGSG
jgi:UDP-N-acetylmuramyl tripeptide synthase